MNKKKALQLLEMQKAKLLDAKHYKDDVWVAQTLSYVKEIFGKESVEYHLAGQIKFHVIPHPYSSDEDVRQALKSKKEDAIKFVDSWIETVKTKGIYKPPNTNVFSRMSDTALWTIIPFTLTATFYLGFWFGSHDKVERQDLPVGVSSFPNPDPVPDTVAQKADSGTVK